jgi:hypothetical protein
VIGGQSKTFKTIAEAQAAGIPVKTPGTPPLLKK